MSDTSEPYDPIIQPLRDETNFYAWKFDITLHLEYLNLSDIVFGTVPRPPTPASSSSTRTPEQKQWDLASSRALLFIYMRLSPSIQASISLPSTAPKVWKMLMREFHRQETTVLMRGLGAITGLHLREGESITEHLKAFEDAWFELRMRTEDAPPIVDGAQTSLETALRILTASELCKAELLINTLSVDRCLVGWDLRDRHGAELRSQHVTGKLMEIHELRESRKRREKVAAAAAVEATRDCTWCRSRGYASAGHGWRKCRRLEKFQTEKKSNARGRKA